MRVDPIIGWFRRFWVDVAWVVFVGLNLLAMRLVPAWQTVPFLVIWVSLTAIYGFRLWRLGSTIAAVAAITVATGWLIGSQVLRGQEDAEYLVEVPLLAAMFVVVVWHAHRRQAAMEETRRVFEQQRRFLQDASHELRTPITVALGHAELIERAATDPTIVGDARVAADELLRLRRLADRMLLLASAELPEFLTVRPVEVGDLVLDALTRWAHTPRSWSVGSLDECKVLADSEHLTTALDALIENAVDHTEAGELIELSVRHQGSNVVVAVADCGSGIPYEDQARIFDRFARSDLARSRDRGGVGLGLAIVKEIAHAHRGSVRVESQPGKGSIFELVLPRSAPEIDGLALTTEDRRRASDQLP
jgi:signal transduction histidine kinase